jgi:hypothetical protein
VTPARLLVELELLAARVGVVVRTEALGGELLEGKGGLCWVRGAPLVVMDAGLALIDRIGVLAGALAHFELDKVYVAPAIRQIIELVREEGSAGRVRAWPSRTSPRPARVRSKSNRRRR